MKCFINSLMIQIASREPYLKGAGVNPPEKIFLRRNDGGRSWKLWV
jgi:hypothetical protein